MDIRLAREDDYLQLAEMKWSHCEEDDIDYNEHNLVGADKQLFISPFIDFLKTTKQYLIFIADNDGVVVSAMFVYMIPKTPKPNRQANYIAYMTNVYTIKEYRNQSIGSELLAYIKKYLIAQKCELLFAWPSENSISWYLRNGFHPQNEMLESD